MNIQQATHQLETAVRGYTARDENGMPLVPPAAQRPLFLIGLIFNWQPLITLGIVFFLLTVLFTLITLPVEFNASKRAMTALSSGGYLDADELDGAGRVLKAAAMTYVAAALTAVLQLLRLLALSNRRRDR